MIYINEHKYIKDLVSPDIWNNWIMALASRQRPRKQRGGNATLITNGYLNCSNWFFILRNNLIRQICIIFISLFKNMIFVKADSLVLQRGTRHAASGSMEHLKIVSSCPGGRRLFSWPPADVCSTYCWQVHLVSRRRCRKTFSSKL